MLATYFGANVKPWSGAGQKAKPNRAKFGFIKNTEVTVLSNLVGDSTTCKAVIRLYRNLFDDGTFGEYAESIIPVFFSGASASTALSMLNNAYQEIVQDEEESEEE